MLLHPLFGKGSENSGDALVADAIRNLIYIWNSKIAKKASGEPEKDRDGEYVKKYKCIPSDSILATVPEQSPTMHNFPAFVFFGRDENFHSVYALLIIGHMNKY